MTTQNAAADSAAVVKPASPTVNSGNFFTNMKLSTKSGVGFAAVIGVVATGDGGAHVRFELYDAAAEKLDALITSQE